MTGDPDARDRMVNLNINAAFRSVQAVLPHRVAQGLGDSLLTSSIAGVVPVLWEPVDIASKSRCRPLCIGCGDRARSTAFGSERCCKGRF